MADPGYIGHFPANIGFSAIAPILCDGVTVYKGLKVLDCRPGEWHVAQARDHVICRLGTQRRVRRLCWHKWAKATRPDIS